METRCHSLIINTYIDIFKLANFSTGPFDEAAMMYSGKTAEMGKQHAHTARMYMLIFKWLMDRK